MKNLFKLLILLKVVQFKQISDNKIKKRINPYNLLSYICIVALFVIYLLRQILSGCKETFKFFTQTNVFKYH